MSYISPIYIDSTIKLEGIDKCIVEEEKGNIPVFVRSKRDYAVFYVNPDVSMNHILTSFQHKSIDLKEATLNICWLSYNLEKRQFQDAKQFSDFRSSFRSIFGSTIAKVVIDVVPRALDN